MVPIRKEVKHEKHRNCFGIILLAIAAPAITFKNIPTAKQKYIHVWASGPNRG
jgi:hypothetical protein